jgi:hypothetical protein
MAYCVPALGPSLEFTQAWLASRSSHEWHCPPSVNHSEMAISLYKGMYLLLLLLIPHTPESNVRACCYLRRKCDGLTALAFSLSELQ